MSTNNVGKLVCGARFVEGGSKVQGPWLELLECPYPQSTDPAKGGNESWKSSAKTFTAAPRHSGLLRP